MQIVTNELFRHVAEPVYMPNQCAVTLAEKDDEGFIDTGNELPVVGPRIYISVSGLKRLAQWYGLSTEDQSARVTELEGMLAEAERERDSLQSALDAVYVLRNNRFSAQAKPGRKTGDKSAAKNLGSRAVKHSDWDEAA